MRSAALALIMSLVSTLAANAGAWLREEGTTFFATTIGTTKSRDFSTTAYAEYGLSERVTIGIDISYGLQLAVADEGSGIVFLRFPLGPTDRTHRFAWHVGIGSRYQNLEFYPAAEVGASWGRGVKFGDRWGWVNVDTSMNTSQHPIDTRFKIDGTLGVTLNDRYKVMGQVFNTFQGGDTYSKVAPSLLISVGKSKFNIQFNAEIPAAGGGETLFKIGIWSEF